MSNNSPIPANNGAVVTISQIIKAVMSSAAEVGLGALFINCREAIPACHTLKAMGHEHPPKPMQTDKTTAHGVITNNIASKRLKSMDMKLHWLRCRIAQKKSPLLATRTQQPRQLRNKTPCGNPPQGGPWDLLDTKTQTRTFLKPTKQKYIRSKGVLDLPTGITKLKNLQTHLRTQIPISTFHVVNSVPTFSPDGYPATVHVNNHNSITTISTLPMSSHCLTWSSLEIAVLSYGGLYMTIAAYHSWGELIYHLFGTALLRSIFVLFSAVSVEKLSLLCCNNSARIASLSVAVQRLSRYRAVPLTS